MIFFLNHQKIVKSCLSIKIATSNWIGIKKILPSKAFCMRHDFDPEETRLLRIWGMVTLVHFMILAELSIFGRKQLKFCSLVALY